MEEKKFGTKLLSCTCKSEYQDRVYGKGMRVHNKSVSKLGTKFRCTICGSVVSK